MVVNHKKLYHIYKTIGLTLRHKCKKRLPQRETHFLFVPDGFTQGWSIDFTSDVLSNGREFRSFNVIDDYNREVLFIEVDYSLNSSQVVGVLQHLIACYGKPQNIRMDNGYIERFNRTYRENVLGAYIFGSLEDVMAITDDFVKDYKHERPHDALGGLSPVSYPFEILWFVKRK